jgi:molecular chaperone GrpE
MDENRVNLEELEDNNADNSENEKSSKKTKPKSGSKKLKEEIEILSQKNEELSDKYLRIVAEYDNYRRRTAKEKIELSNSVKANIILTFLPVVDDMDRAMQFVVEESENDATANGMKLIYAKFYDFLKSQGVEEIEALGAEFDLDLHEAVTKFAAEDPKMKGKVIDVVQKGYTLNDKVIRFSKVVVGE